jgi:predicted AlkP superfamily pyrophosphatase or phosphodiesterase
MFGPVLLFLFMVQLTAFGAPAAQDPASASPEGGSGGINAPRHRGKPFVVLVSFDGYRRDYPERHPTTHLQKLIASGTRSEALVPSWPTETFPNHYTLATGLHPADHGLVANNFPALPSGEWYALKDREAVGNGAHYGGTPIWVLAEQQGMVSASYFWVGSEADVQGIRPSHWHAYDYSVPHARRVQQVLDWLAWPAETRPHLITLYFGIVDDRAHRYGVDSAELAESIEQVDAALGQLMEGIEALPHADNIYLVVVSDHGLRGYEDAPPLVLDEHLALDGVRHSNRGPAVMMWDVEPARAQAMADTINAIWTNGTAYTRASAPAAWRLADNPRFPDLVFQADSGHAVLVQNEPDRPLSPGAHGWAPEVPEMQGVFIARGPGIPAGATVPPLDNRDVFPLLVDWLALEPPAGFTRRSALDRKLRPR